MFTPTQQKILQVLSDGKGHSKEELHKCLPDDLGSLSNVRAHIFHLNKKLRLRGQEVLTRFINGSYLYMHVQHIAPASKE